MAQTNVSLRIDEETKREAEALFSKLGLTLSAATLVFYRQALRTQSIPFPLTAVDLPENKKTVMARGLDAMKAAQAQAKIDGRADTSLDEINKLISESRQESHAI